VTGAGLPRPDRGLRGIEGTVTYHRKRRRAIAETWRGRLTGDVAAFCNDESPTSWVYVHKAVRERFVAHDGRTWADLYPPR
jgi:hypothetical protein